MHAGAGVQDLHHCHMVPLSELKARLVEHSEIGSRLGLISELWQILYRSASAGYRFVEASGCPPDTAGRRTNATSARLRVLHSALDSKAPSVPVFGCKLSAARTGICQLCAHRFVSRPRGETTAGVR
jgi:hypothetical protein